jgi:DNA-binding LytR/AlgR family response regulator
MLKEIFAKPFPYYEDSNRRIKSALFSGGFVFAFLFIFRPFNLHRFENLLTLKITLGYGLITSIMVLLNVFLITSLFPKIFKENTWTVGREIGFIMWIIFTVGLANALYSVAKFTDDLSLEYIAMFQVYTVLVAILPVTINVMVIQSLLHHRNVKNAEVISNHMHHKKRLDASPNAMVTLKSDNKKEELQIPAKSLLYITSADNYIAVTYLEHGKEVQKLLRSTLKNAKEDLRSYTAFYRCHRGWIVNLDRVISVSGNSQGYRLVLDSSDTVIPVSRNLNEDIDSRLSK